MVEIEIIEMDDISFAQEECEQSIELFKYVFEREITAVFRPINVLTIKVEYYPKINKFKIVDVPSNYRGKFEYMMAVKKKELSSFLI